VIDRSIPEVTTWLEGLRHLGYLMQHTVARVMRTTGSELPLKLEYVNLALLMERACDHRRRVALERRLQIHCRAAEVPPVWADRVATAVVADILLSNAVQSSNPDGEIGVQVTAGPGGVVCSLRDDGPGLSAIEVARLLEYSTNPGSLPTDIEGPTVHGLSIAKRLVERMGGRLWAESEPGRGTTMSFRLPYQPPKDRSGPV
jgi:signal transduction histidine kinase